MRHKTQGRSFAQLSAQRRLQTGGAKILVLLLIAALGAGAYVMRDRIFKKETLDISKEPKCKVTRGSMTITVLQSGDIQAAESKPIINETESSCKIVEIVEDGSEVAKGAVLVELDSADLEDEIMSQKAEVAADEASHQLALDTLQINELKYLTDLEGTSLTVELAHLDLEKYEEAEYPQNVLKAKLGIFEMKALLAQTTRTLESTQKLVDKGFSSRQDLEKIELEVMTKEIDLETKEEDLKILQEYTYETDLKVKTNAVSQAEADLEQLKKSYKSERASAMATLGSRKTALEISKNQLKRLENQLEKSTVISEYDGLVFYAQVNRRSSSSEIEKGATIYPRQKILEFPDLSSWQIKIGVPESVIETVKIGQKALASIDALPGQILNAEVTKINIAPDRGDFWMGAASKVYSVMLDVKSSDTLDLKPGMSVMAEVIIKEIESALQVPIQAVRAEGEEHYVYKIIANKAVRTPVEVADNNDDNIVIASGLVEGDELLLYAPVKTEASVSLKESPLEKEGNNGKSADKKSPPQAGKKNAGNRGEGGASAGPGKRPGGAGGPPGGGKAPRGGGGRPGGGGGGRPAGGGGR